MGDVAHHQALIQPFVTELGAKGKVQITAIQDTTFKVVLTGANSDNDPIWDAETARKELAKLLPGEIHNVDQQTDSNLTFMLDSMPGEQYVAWARLVESRIGAVLQTEGSVGTSNQRLNKANAGPKVAPEYKASILVTRMLGECGFGVTIEPDLKLTPQAQIAVIAALRLVMPTYTIVSIGDHRAQMVIATVTP